MKEFEISSSKLVGGPLSEGWVEVYIETQEKFFAVISADQEMDSKIFSSLKDEYYSSEESSFLSLKQAVEKIYSEFKGEEISLEIGAVVLLRDTVYLASIGGPRVWLKRGSNHAQILTSQKGVINTASGKFEPGDKLLLANKVSFDVFSKKAITTALDAQGSRLSIESLTPIMYSTENKKNVGLVVIGVFGDAINREQLTTNIEKNNKNGLKIKLAFLLEKAIKILPDKNLLIDSNTHAIDSHRRNKNSIFIGSFLLIILGISIFFGIKQQITTQRKSKYETRLDEARHELAEAQALGELNTPRARELVLSAREKVLGISSEGVEDSEVDKLTEEINISLGTVAGIFENELKVFLDLGLVDERFSGDDLVISEGLMRVLDIDQRLVISVKSDSKRTEILSGPDLLNDVLQIGAYADRSYVLSSDGVREVGDNVMLYIKPDWEASDIKIKAFAGNIYALDKNENEIWRYAGGGSSFSDKQRWFAPGINPNLENVVSWAIDGKVWLLEKSGKISKYSMGAPEPFSVSEIGKPFSFADIIFTNEETKSLYILDRDNNRIVVINKDGEYKAEYILDNLSAVSGLVVSEADKRIFLLEGSKLMYIEATHLE